MSNIEWNTIALKNLTKIFVRRVISNMCGDESSSIKFGTKGTGQQPNYQITYDDGSIETFNGNNHQVHTKSDSFNDKNLSEPFKFMDLIEL